MYYVIVYSLYMRSPVALTGPFDTKAEARAWQEEHDHMLAKDENMGVMSLTPKHLLLQLRG